MLECDAIVMNGATAARWGAGSRAIAARAESDPAGRRGAVLEHCPHHDAGGGRGRSGFAKDNGIALCDPGGSS